MGSKSCAFFSVWWLLLIVVRVLIGFGLAFAGELAKDRCLIVGTKPSGIEPSSGVKPLAAIVYWLRRHGRDNTSPDLPGSAVIRHSLVALRALSGLARSKQPARNM